MDKELENLITIITMISTLNTTVTYEHVPEIERYIIVVKERTIVIWITLPFNKVPGRVVIEMILFVILWLNSLPPVYGISQTYSPRTILTYCMLYHRWGLPGNYPIFTVVMISYHYVERIWRIIVTPNFLYNIYDHE